MLFEGTVGKITKPYWFASSGAIVDSGSAVFGLGHVLSGDVYFGYNVMFGSNGSEDNDHSAVRPIVILKSDVTVNDVHKIADQTEQEWNTEGVNSYGNGNYGGV